MSRILAIDYGTKRIGLALSDETKIISIPKPFIETSSRGKLLEFIKDNEVEKILIGLPKNLKGEEGAAAKKSRDFGAWIIDKTGLSIEFVDERFSTREAINKLREAGFEARKSKNLKDSMSALVILESYLSKLKNLAS